MLALRLIASGSQRRLLEMLLTITAPHHCRRWNKRVSSSSVMVWPVGYPLSWPVVSAGPLVVAKALNSLREASSLHGFKQPIALDAVRYHLVEITATSGDGCGFMGG